MSARVVCTFGVTIEILAPTSALSSVDLPAFGAPISATKPQRVAWLRARRSAIDAVGLDALARHHGGGGGLLGARAWSARSLRPERASASCTATRNSGSWSGPERATSR